MNKVLIIGGLGFIGHQLANQLQACNYDVSIIDNCAPYTDKSVYQSRLDTISNIPVLNMNVTDVQVSDLKSNNFNTVLHLGSYPNIKEIEANPSLGIASLTHGVFHSIELARSLGATRFIYSSSSMVYGNFSQDPCPETHPRSPQSIYGIYKKAAEDLVKSRCAQYGMEYTIIRPIAVYGPRDNSKRVVSKFFDLARAGAALPVRGDTALDATYVLDTVQGFVCAVKSPNSNLVANISYGTSTTLLQIAQHIIKLTNSGHIEKLPADPIYPTRGALDITAARTLLGYQPQYNILQGLEAYDNFYRSTSTVSGMQN